MSTDRTSPRTGELDAEVPCPPPIDLAAWCDDSLPIERAGVVALHAARCDACRATIAALDPLANEVDPDMLARVVACAEALVDAPAPIRFARIARFTRSTVAAAASLAAAFAGWHAAAYIMTRGADSTTESTLVAAAPATDDATADSIADGAANTSVQLAQGAVTSADASADELSALLTFGLLEEREGVELLDLNTSESTERSDS